MSRVITKKKIYKIGVSSKTGNSRIYIQNANDLHAANFLPGTEFDTSWSSPSITLKVQVGGGRAVVGAKKGGASILELVCKRTTEFCGTAEKVIVTIRANRIVIKLYIQDRNKRVREESFINHLKYGTLTTASLFSGIGVLAYAIHQGLTETGIQSKIVFANDLDPIASDINVNYNPIWRNAARNAMFIEDDIQLLDQTDYPSSVDLLEIGYTCTGLSQLTSEEKFDLKHPVSGKLFISVIEAIKTMNPGMIILECTPKMEKSSTYDCIQNQLTKFGYIVQTTLLKGSEFGDFEHRKRFAMVAVSKGLSEHIPDLNLVHLLHRPNQQTFYDISDTISPVDSSWKSYGHVRARDKMSSVGYKNVLIDAKSRHIPALLAIYACPQTGAPFVRHPREHGLQRQITVAEHAKLRKLPPEMINALTDLESGKFPGRTRTGRTLAHKCLGNSVSPTP